jgi:voltage-gated potassium channel
LRIPLPPWGFYALFAIFLSFLAFMVLHGLNTLTETRSSFDTLVRLLSGFLSGFVVAQYVFIKLYETVGLRTSQGITYDKWDAVYFSIITWTTTGYGDLVPIGASRWVACSEALLGTLYNGIILASVIYQLNLMAKTKM